MLDRANADRFNDKIQCTVNEIYDDDIRFERSAHSIILTMPNFIYHKFCEGSCTITPVVTAVYEFGKMVRVVFQLDFHI